MKTLLTLRDASDVSGIPVSTLWELAAPRGDLPVVRVGRGRGRIYVKREDLDAWIDKRRVAVVDEQPIARAVTRKSISDLPGADKYAH